MMNRPITALLLAQLMLCGSTCFAHSQLPQPQNQLTCEQVITFDSTTGDPSAGWEKQIDNLAEFKSLDSAAQYAAWFYVATAEEVASEIRLRQAGAIERALDARLLPHGGVRIIDSSDTWVAQRRRGYSLPHVTISVTISQPKGSASQATKCW